MPNVSTMNRLCVVCEKTYGKPSGGLFDGCCTPTSLIATRERGFFRKTREYYDLEGSPLNDEAVTALIKSERQKHQRIQLEAEARRVEERKRKEEATRQKQLEELKHMGVHRLERLLRNTRTESRFSPAAGTVIQDNVFELQDVERRRAAINILGETPGADGVTALRNVMADQEDPPRIYSPNRQMKIAELELIRSILDRRRDKNAFAIKCRGCKTELEVTPEIAGTRVPCRNCGRMMLCPTDKSPAEWAQRMVNARDWNGLFRSFSGQDDLDPWFYEKHRAVRNALRSLGVPAIGPIVELLVSTKGMVTGLDDLCAALVGIGDPSAGPYLKLVAEQDRSLRAYVTVLSEVKAFVAQHGSAPCDADLLSRLAAAYGVNPDSGTLDSGTTSGESRQAM